MKISRQLSINGVGQSIASPTREFEAEGGITQEVTLPAAQAGSLTTRTDDNTGTITMSDGAHTIETGDVVDVYWDGGVQYSVSVGTVSGTSVPIDLGVGDNLPAQDTAVKIVPQKTVNVAIDGDNLVYLAISVETNNTALRENAHIQFLDSGSAEIAELDLVTNEPRDFIFAELASNPFTGNPITSVKVSVDGTDATESYKLKIIGVEDSTP